MCFSYDGSKESDINGLNPLRDPLYTLLRTGGDQDSRVGRGGVENLWGCWLLT